MVWIAPAKIQRSIRQRIDSAFIARREACELLERAKRAVEIAIEQKEAAALRYLDRRPE